MASRSYWLIRRLRWTYAKLRPGLGRERTELPPDAVHVGVDGKRRGRRVGRQQSPHVAGDARDPEEPRFVVEKALDGARIDLALIDEIQDHAGVERSEEHTSELQSR